MELALVVLAWPLSLGAEEWSPLVLGSQEAVAPSRPTVPLARSDGESEQAAAPTLRLDAPPLMLAAAESPLALRPPAAGHRGSASERSDREPPPAWRKEAPPIPLRLAAVEEMPIPVDASGTLVAQEQHWSSFLPFFAEEARRLGYELPLPFGVSGIYNYLARDIEVTDVRLGVNGAPLTSVSQFANFNARSTVNAALVKADAWLFPFLNTYLLLGYIYNTSDTNIEVTVPRPGSLPALGNSPL
jgi:hypothetical protein